MNEFVEECRREWRRLGVPDPVANEMAADLAADLEEAEAEGCSAEEVLGQRVRSTAIRRIMGSRSRCHRSADDLFSRPLAGPPSPLAS